MSTSLDSLTSFHSIWLRLSRNLSRLCLEKFLDTSILVFCFTLWVVSSINTGKWSLISDIMTPDFSIFSKLFVRIWSMREDDWLWILVAFPMH